MTCPTAHCSWIFARLAVFPPFFYVLYKNRKDIESVTPVSAVLGECCGLAALCH